VELSLGNAAISGYATYKFADVADIAINTRLAADAVGATKMDRPEWNAVNPANGEIYFTLTNNSNRSVNPTSSSQYTCLTQPTRAPTPTRRARPSRTATPTATWCA
jgi:hypothetical protein